MPDSLQVHAVLYPAAYRAPACGFEPPKDAKGERSTTEISKETFAVVIESISGNGCPEPLKGPTFPLEDRDLPYLASRVVKIVIVRQNCSKLGKYQGSQPKFSPSSSRMRAGQTLPQVLLDPELASKVSGEKKWRGWYSTCLLEQVVAWLRCPQVALSGFGFSPQHNGVLNKGGVIHPPWGGFHKPTPKQSTRI